MEPEKTMQVVMLPFPLQGHINPMFELAKLLSTTANFQITFINSDYTQEKLFQVTNKSYFSTHFPGIHFESISDGLPLEHSRQNCDLAFSTRSVTKPLFKQLLISMQNSSQKQPVGCIIADGFMYFAIDIGDMKNWGFLSCLCILKALIPCGFTCIFQSSLNKALYHSKAREDFDKPITSIPGLENTFRFRDLPNICRFEKADNPILQFFYSESLAMARASGIILNTFEGLESPIISKLSFLFKKIYVVGPLQSLFKSHMIKNGSALSASCNGNLRKEDRSCLTWLDSQPLRSVIYFSLGSIAGFPYDKLMEFWYGLVNSGRPFLWTLRNDMIIGGEMDKIPVELQKGTKERGCIVEWTPQDEVLAHPAIGGFLTHSGWNSTLESIVAGVPTICWPLFSDQQVNSWCVDKIWKIGFEMKDTCDRLVIEKMVRDLMENKREEVLKSMDEIARMARDSVKEGGSSYCNLEKLIADIKLQYPSQSR